MITTVHACGTLVAAGVRRAYASGADEPMPSLVAVWDGADVIALEPPTATGGERDIGLLAALLAEPVAALRRPPARPVWRCTVTLSPTGPALDQQQWADVAHEIVHQAGLARRGETGAVRWVAVGHGQRRIEIVATLVRQDGRIETAPGDRLRCRAATRALEDRYRRRRPTGRVPNWPPPLDDPTPRERLRREVRAAAIIATTDDEFVAALRAGGLQVRLRGGRRNDTCTGYAVCLPSGDATWYSGTHLAPELALTRLRNRWQQIAPSTTTPATESQRDQVWLDAVRAVDDATPGRRSMPNVDVMHAVADLLAATAHSFPASPKDDVAGAAELLHRSVGRQRSAGDGSDPQANHLRALTRLVALIGQIGSDPPPAAALRMVHLLAAFADHLATLRGAQRRRAQATAARAAAHTLRRVLAATAGCPATRTSRP